MLTRYTFKWASLWPLLLWLMANGFILFQAPPDLRYAAALILLAFLPGWVWSQTLSLDLIERIVFSIGLSLALTILATMGAVYLPGPLELWLVLALIDVFIISGYVVNRLKQPTRLTITPKLPLVILIGLLLIATVLRLSRLGYAEFHEDEAEALMLGVRLLQGEDYALFLHRKGPAQMLLPLAFWLFTGQINETLARFPFALSSILSVLTLFVIGRRWFGWQAGLIAGLLWAINGYSLGFGRMVQYQALIFFLGPLALYSLYLVGKRDQPSFKIAAALLLATCLLAHFDALLLLPVTGYLFFVPAPQPLSQGERGYSRSGWVRSIFTPNALTSIIALILFLGVLAAFYIPFILDPEFSNTTTYLAESRVKPGLLYNNLNLLRRLDQDYSSHFYLPLLLGGLLSFVFWYLFNRSGWSPMTNDPRSPLIRTGPTTPVVARSGDRPQPISWPWRWGFLGLGSLALTTYWSPTLWQIGGINLAVLPWLIFGFIGFWQLDNRPVRAAWLMAGVPFIGYVFLVDDPRTHLYILYPGMALLAGAGWGWMIGEAEGWRGGRMNENSTPHPPTSWAPSPQKREYLGSLLPLGEGLGVRDVFTGIATILIGSIIIYEATIFLQTESYLDRLRDKWDGAWWETIYDDLPGARQYFGYPKREGWKAIGALRAQGHFPGDFRSVNEDFIVPIWYNYGEARSCYDTPAHFFVRLAGEETFTPPAPYTLTGQIQREAVTRLEIFSANAAPQNTLTIYNLERLAAAFDAGATPDRYARQTEPTQPVGTQFGPAIQFIGYDLPTATVAPGEILTLNLYWLALDEPQETYRAFVHLTDGTTLWAQQDDNPACRLPTTIWRVGQHGVGQFRLPLPPDMPPGRYPLIIGLYQAETLERLPIVAGAGQVGDDFLWLRDIEVR